MASLVVVSGLPGTGKTTLSRALTQVLRATYLRVDAVESSLMRAGVDVGPLGYEIVSELALSNLLIGRDVITDLVNPLPITRSMWWKCANAASARCVVFECVIPDEAEHRRRVETRGADIVGFSVPTWQDVRDREYAAWDESRDGPRTMIDTTHLEQACKKALDVLSLLT